MIKKIPISLILIPMLLLACKQESSEQTLAKVGNELSIPEAQVMVIHNAVIYTANEKQARAEAMAFNDRGEVLGLGSNQKIQSAYQNAESVDLEGKTVIPGLIDSHGHLTGLALSLTRAQLAGTTTKEEIFERLKEHEQQLSEEDWLLGRGWDQNDWPETEFPNRQELDEHFPDRPVYLVRIDGHASWSNSAALALSDRDLSGDWQPEGGFIHRDNEQQATGVLIDGAKALVQNAIPGESEQLIEAALDLALHRMTSLGLTGVHDPGLNRAGIERYIRLIEADRFPSRVYVMSDGAGQTLEWLCEQGGIRHKSGRLFAHSAKMYEDGALGSRGAALLMDYADDPGNRGLLFLQPDVLQAQIEKTMACGFQAAVHAIGDAGNRVVLDAIEAGILNHPDNPGRHRVEHVQILDANDVDRFAQLGVIAAMQPTHATSDMYWAEERLGPERIRYSYAWRSLLDSGARLALGSDFPVEEVNPMHGIYAAVSRRDLKGWPEGGWYPAEALSRTEALRGFTLDAAYAGFMEEMVGSLEQGKRADFVILDRDIMTVPEDEIPLAVVLETWLDGAKVFSRESID
jgi:predicted amidohydrolase YtcJ